MRRAILTGRRAVVVLVMSLTGLGLLIGGQLPEASAQADPAAGAVPVTAGSTAAGALPVAPVRAASLTRLVTAASPPGAPAGVSARSASHGALVSWKAPAVTGGSPVTGYLIRASPGGRQVRTAAVTKFLVGGLSNGRPYRLTVAAISQAGTGPASKPSALVTPRAPVVSSAVRKLRVAAGFRLLDVFWQSPRTDGGTPVTGYRVSVSPGHHLVTVAGAAGSAAVTGLKDGTSYRVSVVAVNAAGRSRAAVSAGAKPRVTVPGAVASVTAASAASGIALSWTPPAADGGAPVRAYQIVISGTHRKVSAPGTERSDTITGLKKGQSYTLAVMAVNARGPGPATSSAATAGGRVAAHTVVLSRASLAALSEAQTDHTLIFTNPPAQVTKLAVGDVIVAGISPATPGGLLLKVTSVVTAGPEVTVRTSPAALSDALSAAGFGGTMALSSGQVAGFTPARPGVRLLAAGPAPAAGLPGIGISIHTVLYAGTGHRDVSVSGSLSLTPDLSFSASISCCVHVSTKFTATITASAALSLKAGVDARAEGDYPLGEVDFEPIPVDILGVPVVIEPSLDLSLTAKGEVKAGLDTGASQVLTVGGQVTAKDSQVSARPVYSRAGTFTPPAVNGSFTVAAGIRSEFSATFNEIPGPSLVSTWYVLELTADPAASPWWTLWIENVAGIEYRLSLFGDRLADKFFQLLDDKFPLTRAPAPYQDITITPAPAMVNPGGALQLHAKVAAAARQSVTWALPGGGGSITQQGLYTAPAQPGTYLVVASQPPDGLGLPHEGELSIVVGAVPPGAPISPAATSASYGSATVTWGAPANTGGTKISQYTITAHPGSQSQTAAGTATSVVMGNLMPGAQYTFTVTASSEGGSSIASPPSSLVTIDDAATALTGFDGSPGTGAPPARLGPYQMIRFGKDGQPAGGVTSVAGPTGTIGLSFEVDHLKVGAANFTSWSNGYAGDIYHSTGEGFSQFRFTLPPGTRAFYFYAQPSDTTPAANLVATTPDQATSGMVSVTPDGGAVYFGFYATGSAPLTTINISSTVDDTFAVGEFGIAAGATSKESTRPGRACSRCSPVPRTRPGPITS